MSKAPIIMVVDDDRAVLGSIGRDLRGRYGKEYRVVSAESGREALEALAQLEARHDVLALVVSDQRMPDVTGTQLFERAREACRSAKKVLLTAYADTQAAIDAINTAGVDHYLTKPWDPPEERLYPVLDDLLADWRASTYLPWDGIRVVGASWSAAAHDIRSFLGRQRVPYHYSDLETDAGAIDLYRAEVGGEPRVPAVFFPDGAALVQPQLQELAERIGLTTEAKSDCYDVVVIGAGPAGLAASVYCAAEGLRCLVIERAEIGGLASTSPKIENYLGFPAGIAGADLTRRARDQAIRLGAEILSLREVSRIRLEDPYRIVELRPSPGDAVSAPVEISCNALLIATGAAFRELPAKGAERFRGMGIYYAAAHSEAAHCSGQDVFIVGGANSGAQAALLMSRYARRVYMLVREAAPMASQYLLDAVAATPSIEVLCDTVVEEIRGDERIEEVVVKSGASGEPRGIRASALFVFIGVRPASDFVADVVRRNDRGFVLTGPQLMQDGKRPAAWPLSRDPMLLETSVPGVFAAGDVRAGTIGRVAWAAGEGGAAVSMILEYLKGWEAGSRGAASA